MSDTAVQTRTIKTRIPARLDRLPWSRFHWRILIGLGTVWILDGLEVTMVGTVASRITEKGSSLSLTPADIGIAGAIYIVGACLGALYFGHLTDRFGRKKLFMLTLGIYILATFATAFSFAPWWFFLARFFTGAGIGGEYAAINSAIDELIPARVRGRVDLVINGTYWAGSAAGSALALVFLNEAWIPGWLGWRLAFGIGVVLGLSILLVRRHVPESPRWLFIHGREEEAERIVDGIEREVREETGSDLERAGEELTIRQRTTIPFRTIAHTAFKLYPRRAILGLALFIGQAFIYNGITFNLGTLFTQFYEVSSSFVPVFVIIYAVGNLLGPITLGRLFDTVGRKPMISGTYLGSAIATIPLGLVFLTNAGNEWLLILLIVLTFFLASAGASAAYLTVSEIFPMETRALAIAFFYAVGTAVGGIAGPLLFGQLIGSGQRGLVTIAFFIGAAVMAMGGVAELILGVKAERASLESIAQPLTAAEADDGGDGADAAGAHRDGSGGGDAAAGDGASGGDGAAGGDGVAATGSADRARQRAQWCREQAEQARASAAEHRAEHLELADSTADDAADRRELAALLAETDELRAQELEQQALAYEELARGAEPGAMERAQAAEQRARALAERAAAVSSADAEEYERHLALAEAATERARAREQFALAVQAEAGGGAGGPDGRAAPQDGRAGAPSPPADGQPDGTPADQPPDIRTARAAMHRAWASCHEERAQMHDARAAGNDAARAVHEQAATAREHHAMAAEERLQAAEHRVEARQWHAERAHAQDEQRRRAEQARLHLREEAEREDRIRRRIQQRQAGGLARLRPGPGTALAPLWSGGPASRHSTEVALDREIEVIGRALDHHGPTERQELARMVGARYWGPGRFGAALDNAVAEGRVRRLSRRTFGPASPDGAAGASGSDGAATSDGSDDSVSGVGPAGGAAGSDPAAGSDSAVGAAGGVGLDGGFGADGTGSAGPPR
ncbi:MAG TPA: MFS transporter [Nakamurella sp.]|nr:MFS transporter [Nakamurella sp.]